MKKLDVVKLNDAETEEHNLYKLLIKFVAEKKISMLMWTGKNISECI